MKILLNLVKGFSITGKSWRMVLMLYIFNLLFALILAVPMYHALKGSFGQSLVGENMAEGFDYLWWEEFSDNAEGIEKTFSPSIIGMGALLNNWEALLRFRLTQVPPSLFITALLYLLFHVFLAGGILTVFTKENPKFSIGDFFRGAGHLFSRFTGIALCSAVFFLIIALVIKRWFDSLHEGFKQTAVSEVGPFIWGLVFCAVILILLFFVQMVFDYARIHSASTDTTNIFQSIKEAFRFVFRNLPSTLGLFYLVFLLSIGLSIVYVLATGSFAKSAPAGVTGAFILQQVFIFSTIGLRCILYSSQVRLYEYLR